MRNVRVNVCGAENKGDKIERRQAVGFIDYRKMRVRIRILNEFEAMNKKECCEKKIRSLTEHNKRKHFITIIVKLY